MQDSYDVGYKAYINTVFNYKPMVDMPFKQDLAYAFAVGMRDAADHYVTMAEQKMHGTDLMSQLMRDA